MSLAKAVLYLTRKYAHDLNSLGLTKLQYNILNCHIDALQAACVASGHGNSDGLDKWTVDRFDGIYDPDDKVVGGRKIELPEDKK